MGGNSKPDVGISVIQLLCRTTDFPEKKQLYMAATHKQVLLGLRKSTYWLVCSSFLLVDAFYERELTVFPVGFWLQLSTFPSYDFDPLSTARWVRFAWTAGGMSTTHPKFHVPWILPTPHLLMAQTTTSSDPAPSPSMQVQGMSTHTDRLLRLMVENGVTNTAVLERLNAERRGAGGHRLGRCSRAPNGRRIDDASGACTLLVSVPGLFLERVAKTKTTPAKRPSC